MAIKKDTKDADLLAQSTASGIKNIQATSEGIEPLYDADGNVVQVAGLKEALKNIIKRKPVKDTKVKTETKPEGKVEEKPVVEEKPIVDEPLTATNAREANEEAIARKVKEAVDDPLTMTSPKDELYGTGQGPKSDLEIKTESEAEQLVIAAEKAEGTVESGKEAGFNFSTFNSEQDVYKYLEAVEFKSTEQTVKDADTSYRVQHQAKGPNEDAARLDNVTKDIKGENSGYPDDFYGVDGSRLYAPGPTFKGDLYGKANLESYNIITKVKDNPEAIVTIYRAVPNEANITTINYGDFVTLSRTYAELHAASGYGPKGDDKGKILSKKVKVKDIFHDGNDVNEFGFFGGANQPITVKTVRDFKTVVSEARTGLEAELGLKKDFYTQNKLFTDTQVVEIKRMLEASTLTVRDLATKIRAGANDTKTLFEFRQAAVKHAGIIHIFKTGRANVARSLNAFKIPNDYKGTINDFEEAMLNELGGSEASKTFANKLLEQNSPESFNKMIEDGKLQKAKNVFFELYINGLLSGPRTHLVNTIGNGLYQSIAIPELTIAAIYGKVETGVRKGFNKVTKSNYFNEKESVQFNEVYYRAASYLGSVNGALKAANESFARPNQVSGSKIELSGPSQDYISSRYLNLNPDKYFGKGIDMLGKGIRFPGSALIWGDEFFKTIAREAEKAEMIARKTNELVASGKTDKDEIAEIILDWMQQPSQIKTVEDAALYYSFQSQLGSFGQDIQKLQNSAVIRITLPFMKTPTNIFKAVGSRTPLSPVVQSIFDSTYKQKFINDNVFRSKEIGKITLGSMLVGYAANQFLDGKFTAAPPRDKSQRDFLYSIGWQPYSLVVRGKDTPEGEPNFDPYTGLPNGTHTYFNYGGMEPVAAFFAVTGAAVDLMNRSNSPMVRDSVAAATYVAITNYVEQLPFLQSIAKINRIVFNNIGGDQGPQFERVIAELTQMIIPFRSLFSGVEKITNPSKLDVGYEFSEELDMQPYMTDDDGNVLYNDNGSYKHNINYLHPKKESFINNGIKKLHNLYQIASNASGEIFPFEIGNIPVQRDYFGDEQEVGNGLGWGLRTYNFISPLRISAGQDLKPYEAELFRLGMPGQSYSKKISGVKFDDKAWDLYTKYSFQESIDPDTGMNFRQAIENLYYSPEYSENPENKTLDEYRISLINGIRKRYSELGMELLSMHKDENGDLPYLEVFQAIEFRNQLQDDGMLPRSNISNF